MLSYIAKIQQGLIDNYGFAPRTDAPGIPSEVPDGEYPMEIDGRIDHVRIENGYINCCNWGA